MTRVGLEWFRRHGLQILPKGGRCVGTGYLDRDLHSLFRSKRWRTVSGIVRMRHRLAMIDGAHPVKNPDMYAKRRWLNEPENDWLWECNITAKSRHRCRQKRKKKAPRPLSSETLAKATPNRSSDSGHSGHVHKPGSAPQSLRAGAAAGLQPRLLAWARRRRRLTGPPAN